MELCFFIILLRIKGVLFICVNVKRSLYHHILTGQITQLEETVNELQTKVRFRKVDLSDTYELQYALVRLEQMKQVCKDITVFLNFDKNFLD